MFPHVVTRLALLEKLTWSLTRAGLTQQGRHGLAPTRVPGRRQSRD